MGGANCLYPSVARNWGWTVISCRRGKQARSSWNRLRAMCTRDIPMTGSRSRRSTRPPVRSFERKPLDTGWLPKSRGVSRFFAGEGEEVIQENEIRGRVRHSVAVRGNCGYRRVIRCFGQCGEHEAPRNHGHLSAYVPGIAGWDETETAPPVGGDRNISGKSQGRPYRVPATPPR